ncbi:exodeoxyribonuclease III [Glycomyces algeriensis]|uniref:Exodeoxyribonuclease n=1 Tax=Glycomyces algeriensis TaxID=256037 RepID=A0A9W6GAZ4_9ACTN|nr:exodeoxyribonuclease III [Glycomyces algeriensis]MDA1367329.1 exodeoxyribonuclease III [Glycomyces algeriensis]MDR7351018.1 exodeoxyribonuclease-3 [Glycomyces algeriensis]GLI43731.1 exodeoxyribonuclease [Glycomyces algeriensis]
MRTIATANVNGIRAAAKKGIIPWLEQTQADVVLLQEVRAAHDQIPAEALEAGGWHWHVAPSTVAKGRAGVAVLTRTEPEAVRTGFGGGFDDHGRYAEVDLPGLTVASLYLPSGETDTPRQVEKERFMAVFAEYLAEAAPKAQAAGRELLVCGDWNIAHAEADLKNWKSNKKTAGFLPNERAWLTDLYATGTFVDVVRALHPGVEGPYSWWSFRGRAFDNDAGWRIDLHVATTPLADKATKAWVDRAAAHDQRWSDHAPVLVTYDH